MKRKSSPTSLFRARCPPEKGDPKTYMARFAHRQLLPIEEKAYQVEGGSHAAKQEKINQQAYEKLLHNLPELDLRMRLTREHVGRPLLKYHLDRFAAKNTRDYFIHPNLREFLMQQLFNTTGATSLLVFDIRAFRAGYYSASYAKRGFVRAALSVGAKKWHTVPTLRERFAF
ncbi:MAG: hypothetical protein ACUVRD_08965 [Bacteroidia bacterium]